MCGPTIEVDLVEHVEHLLPRDPLAQSLHDVMQFVRVDRPVAVLVEHVKHLLVSCNRGKAQ